MWHITQEEWIEKSGRGLSTQRENKRRQVNTSYAKALYSFSETRNRCADLKTFMEYMKVAFGAFHTISEELTCDGRAIANWEASRSLQSFLANIANRIFKNGSTRLNRHFQTSLTEEERTKLRIKLKILRQEKRETKRVALFGDATFKSTRKGKVALPKKALLKVMAAIGLTFLIGEYRTSKMCPCGEDELITPKGGAKDKRVRVHKTSGGVCSVLKMINDRDETADVNFGLGGLNCCRGNEWPLHLQCSPCSESN